MSRLRGWGSQLALYACGALLVGCSSSDTPSQEEGSSPEEVSAGLQRARGFKEFTPLWLGPSYEGQALSEVEPVPGHVKGAGTTKTWLVAYGPLMCSGSYEDETHVCDYDIQLQVEDICVAWPERMDGPPGTEPFRGARAAWSWSLGQFDVFTGDSTVHVYGGRKQAMEIAAELRPIGTATPVKNLAPPLAGALEGELPCQRPVAAHLFNLDSEAQAERRCHGGKPKRPPESYGPFAGCQRRE